MQKFISKYPEVGNNLVIEIQRKFVLFQNHKESIKVVHGDLLRGGKACDTTLTSNNAKVYSTSCVYRECRFIIFVYLFL